MVILEPATTLTFLTLSGGINGSGSWFNFEESSARIWFSDLTFGKDWLIDDKLSGKLFSKIALITDELE